MSNADVPSGQPAAPFSTAGNLLCLDLVNTEVISQGVRVDRMQAFDDLMRWARVFGIVTEAEERNGLAEWGGSRQAAAVVVAAKELRQALRVMAEALAAGGSVPDSVVAAINEALAVGASVLRLERRGSAYVTTRQVLADTPTAVLAPVAESAAWLLERGDLAQVRRCENPACILFFYDTTKNKRRRWCAMEACGSRAKAAAYYRRSRAASRKGEPSRKRP